MWLVHVVNWQRKGKILPSPNIILFVSTQDFTTGILQKWFINITLFIIWSILYLTKSFLDFTRSWLNSFPMINTFSNIYGIYFLWSQCFFFNFIFSLSVNDLDLVCLLVASWIVMKKTLFGNYMNMIYFTKQVNPCWRVWNSLNNFFLNQINDKYQLQSIFVLFVTASCLYYHF